MTSIKTVLIEMLSTFEAKGKMGAKQLKEQLHMGWPVPSSQGYLEQLRKELKAAIGSGEIPEGCGGVRGGEMDGRGMDGRGRGWRRGEAESKLLICSTCI